MLVGLLSAIHHRRRTGQGQQIELRQYESIVNFNGTVVMDYAANGHQQTRMGSRSEFAAPHGVYRCAGEDRWCVITVENHQAWSALCRAVGHLAWLTDERFATFAARKNNEDELDRLLQTWTSIRSPEDAVRILQEARVAAGMVQHAGDLMEHDPQLAARQFYVPIEHPDMGAMLHEGLTFKLSGTDGGVHRRAPLLGEHNDYVLQELLGLAEEEVNGLITSGVVM